MRRGEVDLLRGYKSLFLWFLFHWCCIRCKPPSNRSTLNSRHIIFFPWFGDNMPYLSCVCWKLPWCCTFVGLTIGCYSYFSSFKDDIFVYLTVEIEMNIPVVEVCIIQSISHYFYSFLYLYIFYLCWWIFELIIHHTCSYNSWDDAWCFCDTS